MQALTYDDILKIQDITRILATQWNHRGQAPLAFGRNGFYKSLGYMELDVVSIELCRLLAQQLGRDLAAALTLDQWGVHHRVVAQAEATPERPVFYYATSYKDKSGKSRHLTLGSMLDPDQPGNLYAIASDIRARTGVTVQKYVCVEMTEVLRRVRAKAAKAGYDFSAPFLPPLGSPQLEELLQPYSDAMPDRAVVVNPAIAKRLMRAGVKARMAAEESMAVH